MRNHKLILTFITVVMILSFPLSVAGAVPPADEGSGVDIVWDDPIPVYPYEETIFDKTPEFQFSQYESATKYRIKVRNYEDQNIVYYTYIGTATCEDFECWMTPDIPLAGGVITFEKPLMGYYEWTVQAKVAPGVWTPVQSYVPFGLGVKRINSQFTSDKNGWVDRYAQWKLAPGGYLKNIGLEREYTSTLYKKKVYPNFTAEARIKLKSSTAYAPGDLNRHFGGIILFGNGMINSDPDDYNEMNVWRKGIYVVIRNNQQAAIFLWDGGTLIDGIGWQSCPSIVTNGWNTIKVTEVDGMITVFVNGTQWKTYTHPFAGEPGYLGLTQYRYTGETESMLVDWVMLKVDVP